VRVYAHVCVRAHAHLCVYGEHYCVWVVRVKSTPLAWCVRACVLAFVCMTVLGVQLLIY